MLLSIKVNDKIVTDYVDDKKTNTAGYVAFQQHNQGSVVQYRKVVVKPLPQTEKAAWAIARKDVRKLK